MKYSGKLIFLTGATGFIGKALESRLKELGATVQTNNGRDIRSPETFAHLDQSYDYIFHFAAPSSQVLFKRKPGYCIEATMLGFINAAQAAQKHGIRLIYPSTGLLSQGRFNEYAMCKKLCEDYVSNSGIDALGLRIFATYGPGEGHKADYASVPYLFARDMLDRNPPVIFGDGEQTRDFIYIDDVIESILHAAEEYHKPILDVGSGVATSFNQVIETIAKVLAGNDMGTTIMTPTYVDKPANYVTETLADRTELDKIVPGLYTSLERGIEKMIYEISGKDKDVEIL